MDKQILLAKRNTISALIDAKLEKLRLNNNQTSKLCALTPTQVKSIRDGNYGYTAESLISILLAVGVDLEHIISKELKSNSND